MKIEHSKILPPCDVAIVGAGPAGIAAALAAAHLNARVTLLDAAPTLGGSVTAAMHRSLCGLYASLPDDPRDTLNPGPQRDLISLLLQKAPTQVTLRQFGPATVLEFPTPAWQASLTQLLQHPLITLRLSTPVTAATRDSSRVTSLTLPESHLETPTLIDCTGEARILQLLGPDTLHPLTPNPRLAASQREACPSPRMLGGFALRLSNLHGNPDLLRLRIPHTLAQAVQSNLLPHAARFTTFYPGPNPNEGILKLAIPENLLSDSPNNPAEQFALSVLAHLTAALPEFSSVTLLEKSPRPLPRDGRHLLGLSTLTEQDILSPRPHSPHSPRAWWPLEHWHPQTGPSYLYPPPNTPYDIPLTTLQSAVLPNLFAAGNCLSATPAAAASSRASGICLATGSAAGTLAATH